MLLGMAERVGFLNIEGVMDCTLTITPKGAVTVYGQGVALTLHLDVDAVFLTQRVSAESDMVDIMGLMDEDSVGAHFPLQLTMGTARDEKEGKEDKKKGQMLFHTVAVFR